MNADITVEDERIAFRYTTVHSRYHVAAIAEDMHCDTEFAQSIKEAEQVARSFLRDKSITKIEVFDSMAHKGNVELWELGRDSSLWKVARRRAV